MLAMIIKITNAPRNQTSNKTGNIASLYHQASLRFLLLASFAACLRCSVLAGFSRPIRATLSRPIRATCCRFSLASDRPSPESRTPLFIRIELG